MALSIVEGFKTDLDILSKARDDTSHKLQDAIRALAEARQRVLDLQQQVVLFTSHMDTNESIEAKMRESLEFWVKHPPTDGSDPTFRLPDMVLARVFSYVPMCEVFLSVALVCRRWSRLVKTKSVTRHFKFDIRFTKYVAGELIPVELEEDCPVNCIVVFKNGTRLYAGLNDASVSGWNLTGGFAPAKTQRLLGHTESVNCLALSPDDRVLFSGADDSKIKVWDTTEGSCLKTVEALDGVSFLLGATQSFYSVDSLSEDYCVKVWSCDSFDQIQTLRHGSVSVSALTLTSDGRLVTGDWDGSIILWSAGEHMQELKIPAHSQVIHCLTVSNNLLYSGSEDGQVCIWDLSEGPSNCQIVGIVSHPTTHLTVAAMSRVVICNGDGRMFTGEDDGCITMWSTYDNSAKLSMVGALGILSLSFTQGRLFAGDGSDTIRIY
eukprot:m.150794 g.150794  ORF g.150794 m.150794 type:complete len:436 (-) comp30742_c0_seq1:75-1382(-)